MVINHGNVDKVGNGIGVSFHNRILDEFVEFDSSKALMTRFSVMKFDSLLMYRRFENNNVTYDRNTQVTHHTYIIG